MKPRSLEKQCFAPDATTTFWGRASSKPSMLKRLKMFVGGSYGGTTRVTTRSSSPSPERRRRAEALKSAGLLKQSVKYGSSYRDEEDDQESRTIIDTEECWGDDKDCKRDLIFFEDKVNELSSEKDGAFSSVDEKGLFVSVCTPPPPPPTTPNAKLSSCLLCDCCSSEPASPVESEASTLASGSGHRPVRVRRLGSLVEEIEQIKDEESRRLTELAYLS